MIYRATLPGLRAGAITAIAFLFAAPVDAAEPSSSFLFHVPEVRWGIVLRRSTVEGGYRTDRETTGGPGLLITSPALEGTKTAEEAIRLSGRVEAGARLELAGKAVALSTAGSFAERIKLSAGVNAVDLSVRNTDGATDYRIEIAREKPTAAAEKKAIGEKFRRARQGKVSGPAAPLQVVSGGARLLAPEPGTLLKILGREQDSYRVELSRSLSALVDVGAVKLLGNYPADPAVVGNVVLDPSGNKIIFTVPRRVPAEAELLSPAELRLTFYNASVGTSEINLGNGDLSCRWTQEEDGRASYLLSGPLSCHRWSLIWRNGRYELAWKDRPRGVAGAVVAIDPGHGGDQEGAVSPMGIEEKEANLLLARALKERLAAAGVIGLLSREDDRPVALDRRVAFALQSEADLLVSLHFNSVAETEDPREKTGFTVYHYQPPSLELARSLDRSLAGLGLQDNGVRWRSLAVLRSPPLVSALVETAFLSNPEDEARIIAPDFLDRAAGAIAEGILNYLENPE